MRFARHVTKAERRGSRPTQRLEPGAPDTFNLDRWPLGRLIWKGRRDAFEG